MSAQPGFDHCLRGTSALITGASSGIGRAIAVAFAAQGSAVAVHYYQGRERAVDLVAQIQSGGGQAVALQADITVGDQARDLVARSADQLGGRLDIVVNSAATMGRRVPLEQLADEDVERLLALNVAGMLYVCRAAIPYLGSTRGNFVNVSSAAADTGGGPGAGAYAATKGAVNALTRALAKELAPSGIRANAISPGPTDTPMHEATTDPDQLERIRAGVLMGRLARPEEMVGAALLLASDHLGSFITGEVVAVNGGSWFS